MPVFKVHCVDNCSLNSPRATPCVCLINITHGLQCVCVILWIETAEDKNCKIPQIAHPENT